MLQQVEIVRHEGSASEREALDWVVGSLKYWRTLEVFRTQGPAPARPHRESLEA